MYLSVSLQSLLSLAYWRLGKSQG